MSESLFLITIILIAFNVSLAVVLILLLFSLFKIDKKYADKEKAFEKEKSELLQSAKREISQFSAEQQQLLKNMISIWEMQTKQLAQTLTSSLMDSSQILHSRVDSEITRTTDTLASSITSLQSDLHARHEAYVSELRMMIESQTGVVVTQMMRIVEQERADLHTSLGQYADERKKELKDEFESRFKSLAVSLLNETLTPEQHERLILEAMKRAKEEGVFNEL